MSQSLAMLALAVAALTAVAAVAYRALWLRVRATTPTGFGALLAPAMLAAAALGGASQELIWSLEVVALASLSYWFDDALGLGAWLRVGICAAAGIAIGAIYLAPSGLPLAAIVGLALLAGFVNVATVNVVNFQDGADLNLALFLLLTAGLLLGFAPDPAEWSPVAVACIAFAVPFAVINSRPGTLYFGDSGSFAFGALFTVMGAALVAGHHPPAPEAAIPTALPLIDTVFVTAHRIRIRQPFTTRHYFHLYQRLQRSHAGFSYLVPQLVSVGLCLGVAELLQRAGLGRVLSVGTAMTVVSVVVFATCHRFFAVGEPGPPLPKEAQT